MVVLTSVVVVVGAAVVTPEFVELFTGAPVVVDGADFGVVVSVVGGSDVQSAVTVTVAVLVAVAVIVTVTVWVVCFIEEDCRDVD